MNDPLLGNKVRQDVATFKKDLSILEGDRAARLGRFEENVSQARVEIANWVDDGVSKLNGEIDRLTDDAKVVVADVTAGVKKDVSQGLNQYNRQAQTVADRVPGDFSRNVDRYPWVAISAALAIGYLLGRISMSMRYSRA
jgi:hypothetical protein